MATVSIKLTNFQQNLIKQLGIQIKDMEKDLFHTKEKLQIIFTLLSDQSSDPFNPEEASFSLNEDTNELIVDINDR